MTETHAVAGQNKKLTPITGVLVLMLLAAFILYIPPNAAASENLAMVQMFEPDEAAPLPSLLAMITPKENLDQTLRGFLFYKYYYYGFPYFALSALVIMPLKIADSLQNIPLVMVFLRQMISVLPMLIGLLLIVYMHDRFKSYRSIMLYAFLLAVPAVMGNNFWWHPDGLVFLLVALTLFFLERDNLRFGRNFFIAAVITGITAATKIIGVYFFLAVGLTIHLGLINKKLTWKKLIWVSLAYILILAAAFIIANPFLISDWARIEYYDIFTRQTELLSEGYGIQYDKGLLAAWPTMQEYYGSLPFLLTSLIAALWGAFKGPRRLLYGLIIAWFIPLTVSILTISHFKFQYWLPVALPLISCVYIFLPERLDNKFKPGWGTFTRLALIGVLLVQLGLFLTSDITRYTLRLNRMEDNPRIQFHQKAVEELGPLEQTPIHVYYDYRMYAPPTALWNVETSYDLLDYEFINEKDFDVLLLLEQRIRDYLNPEAAGIDPAAFALNQEFYRDADSGSITGYQLVYRDEVGLVFVRDDQYGMYYPPQ